MTGFEPLIAAATAGLTALVTDIIKDKGGKLLKQADIDLLKPRLAQASRQYIENYRDRHSKLKVFRVGMHEPEDLESVYTTVQVLDRSESRYYESLETLQDLFRQSGRGFEVSSDKRQDGIAVVNQHQYLMVLGGPGIGKSTFLRKVGLEALKLKQGAFRHDCMPVFLELKNFNSNEIKIEKLITEEFEACGFPDPEAFTKQALEKGKLLVLLDGLDEVPTENLDRAITQIQNLVDRYRQNRFIASCRIAAYKGGFKQFKDVTVAAFEDTQIEVFIKAWFRAEPEMAKQCWKLLKQDEYKAAKELAQTPLLLTLLCVVYDQSLNFPKNRAALYGEALDVLLKKWAAEKRVKREIYRELSPELEQILLAEIAYTSFSDDQLFLRKQELIGQIKHFLVDNLNAPKHLDGEAVLNAIEVQQGIFVERARDTYSFSHLTLQEYLTALYVSQDHRQVEKLVTNHLVEDRWREVFLLVAGLQVSADELLELMEKAALTYLNTPKLKALLTWAEQVTEGSQRKLKSAAKRVTAIYLALDLDRALDLALALARAALDLDRALDRARRFENLNIFKSVNFTSLIARLEALKARVPDDNQPREVRQEFVKRIYQTWFDALYFKQEWADLSEEEVEALANYLYANQLMVKCKEAAVRVSQKKWEILEERMLKISSLN